MSFNTERFVLRFTAKYSAPDQTRDSELNAHGAERPTLTTSPGAGENPRHPGHDIGRIYVI